MTQVQVVRNNKGQFVKAQQLSPPVTLVGAAQEENEEKVEEQMEARTQSEHAPESEAESPSTPEEKPSAKRKAKAKGETPKTESQERKKPEKPAHMTKVEKVAAQLPPLSSDASVLFAAANNMSTSDITSLVAHLNIVIRRRGVVAVAQGTASPAVKPGARVSVRGGQAKFIGQSGIVTRVQRIRCYVRLDGRDKDDYFFIADVAPVGQQHLNVTPRAIADTIARLSAPSPSVDINTVIDDVDPDEGLSATG